MTKSVSPLWEEPQALVVQSLIDAGGKVRKTAEALELVAYNGKLQFVKILLKWGVSQEGKDAALYTAVAMYKQDVAMELLDAGAMPKAAGDPHFRESTLHRAVQCGSMEIVLRLLDLGADPLQKDKDGNTPIDVAKNMRKHDIARLLKAKAAEAEEKADQV
jgi:ankyrin repeat protein